MLNTLARRAFSKTTIPIVDLTKFLKEGRDPEQEKEVARAFHKLGVLIVKDPRVEPKLNEDYISMVEKYFYRIGTHYYKTKQLIDVWPNLSYQTGATPELLEKAKPHKALMDSYSKENAAVSPVEPTHDAKWRYIWRIGDTKDSNLPPRHAPYEVPEWQFMMDKWGTCMVQACLSVAEMSALGLGVDRSSFSSRMDGGPHILAPTASDLTRYKPGTIFAGFHYDFNFLTIHGRSRFPGLFCWTRENQRFSVSVPEGHLLLQAGKEFEMLTGGYINCGYHQVIYTKEVETAKDKALQEGKIPWRVSSTLFSHIRYDVDLSPLEKFRTEESVKKYPKITAQEHSARELQSINLSGK